MHVKKIVLGVTIAFVAAMAVAFGIFGTSRVVTAASQDSSYHNNFTSPKNPIKLVGVPAIKHVTNTAQSQGTTGITMADVTNFISTYPIGMHWDLEGSPHYDLKLVTIQLMTIGQVNQMLGETSLYSSSEEVYVVTFHHKNTVIGYMGAKPMITYHSIMVFDAQTGNYLLSVAIAPPK